MRSVLATAAALVSCVIACDPLDDSSSRFAPFAGAPCGCEELPASLPEIGVAPVRGGKITIRISSEPGTLLSLYSPHEAIADIVDHDVLEALVGSNRETGEPTAQLAVGWDIDEGAGTYTFHLDPEARWHDGAPVTSADVAYTFDLLLDAAGGAILRGEFLDVASIETPDDLTVSFGLDRARPDFLADLSRVSILPMHVFRTDLAAAHPASRAPIGSGPFIFREWKRGSHIALEANPDWRGEPVNVDEVVYRIVPERRVAVDLLRIGELDVVTDAGSFAAGFREGGRALAYPMEAYEAIVYNTSRSPFHDATVRRAIGSLVDRETVRCSILACLADPIDDPWPALETTRGDVPSRVFFDPAGARRSLVDAGWTDKDGDGRRERGGEPLSFSLMYMEADRDVRRAMTVVQYDLARAGIEMRLDPVSRAVFADRLLESRFDAAIVTVPNSHPFDPSPFFRTAASGTGRNYGRFFDDVTDRLLDTLARETDEKARAIAIHELGGRLAREQPVTFTFRPKVSVIARESVRNLLVRGEWIDERALWLDPSRAGGRP